MTGSERTRREVGQQEVVEGVVRDLHRRAATRGEAVALMARVGAELLRREAGGGDGLPRTADEARASAVVDELVVGPVALFADGPEERGALLARVLQRVVGSVSAAREGELARAAFLAEAS